MRVEGVHKIFPGGVTAVGGVDLDIAEGAFVALLGPSGCGKSTLLRLIAGLDRPTLGTIQSSPDAQNPARPAVAFVFQDAHLLPWRRVLDNVALPLELAGLPASERRQIAREALANVGLEDAILRYPAELSGGMRMRASLARALVTNPRLLLLDEPFGALDELTRNRLDDDLRALWIEKAMTVLFVTHSISEAVYLAERAVVFSRRPARVIADRAIDLPRARSAKTRLEPAFAAEVQALYEALVQAGA
ncbi:MAG: ABC transporter ATP-binding protein [Polyangiaceae bacterium]|nr:ABC transporter ATP-binding protein [Polyangiaceae bacterium]